MRGMFWIVGALALTSCSDKADGAGGEGSGENESTGCELEDYGTTYPESDGATDFYYRAKVEFELDAEDSGATLTLADASGAAIDGSTSWSADTKTLSFDPTQPLVEIDQQRVAFQNSCVSPEPHRPAVTRLFYDLPL